MNTNTLKRAVLLLVATAVLALAANCPFDNLFGTFVRYVLDPSGPMMAEYRCPRGHLFYVQVASKPAPR
jgi:hypothetical protein